MQLHYLQAAGIYRLNKFVYKVYYSYFFNGVLIGYIAMYIFKKLIHYTHISLANFMHITNNLKLFEPKERIFYSLKRVLGFKFEYI